MTTPHGPLTDETESRWTSRPALAAVLRTAVLAAPPVSALLVALLVMSQVSAEVPLTVRVLLVAVVAVATALVLERLLRRLMPLESLLRMTMLSPAAPPPGSPSPAWAAAAPRSSAGCWTPRAPVTSRRRCWR